MAPQSGLHAWSGQRRFEQLLASRTGHACLSGAGLAYAAMLFANNPTGSHLFPKCLIFTLTGLHCPGCGVQRAAHALMHLNVFEAVSLNVLSVCVLPFLMLAYCRWTARVWWNAQPLQRRPRPRLILLLAASVAAFWLLRNLPLSPFDYLAPPAQVH